MGASYSMELTSESTVCSCSDCRAADFRAVSVTDRSGGISISDEVFSMEVAGHFCLADGGVVIMSVLAQHNPSFDVKSACGSCSDA